MNLKNYPSKEYALITRLKDFVHSESNNRYSLGIGDDAAIRQGKGEEKLIFTADTLVENVHFSFSYMTAEEVGYKSMVVNLSDCAAMGATPDAALIQMVFPKKLVKKDINEMIVKIYSGFNHACKKWNFPIIGGDLSAGPCWILAISLIGRSKKSSRLTTRSGTRVGDTLWATGIPGKSAAGLAVLEKWGRNNYSKEFHECVTKHIAPTARIELGKRLAEDTCVHSVIDLSDGISKECYTLCYDNQIGIILAPDINWTTLPFTHLETLLRKPLHSLFLYGGEDYELLFTTDKQFNPLHYDLDTLCRLGTITDSSSHGVTFLNPEGSMIPVDKKGWDHLLQ